MCFFSVRVRLKKKIGNSNYNAKFFSHKFGEKMGKMTTVTNRENGLADLKGKMCKEKKGGE